MSGKLIQLLSITAVMATCIFCNPISNCQLNQLQTWNQQLEEAKRPEHNAHVRNISSSETSRYLKPSANSSTYCPTTAANDHSVPG